MKIQDVMLLLLWSGRSRLRFGFRFLTAFAIDSHTVLCQKSSTAVRDDPWTSSTVQSTAFNVVFKRPPVDTKTASTRMTSASSGRAWHALIRTHHITSRKKVAKLRQSASAEDVYALIHNGGPPGIMYVEGDKSGVASWVAAVQVCQQSSSLSAFHRRTSCRFWHAYRCLSTASPL